LPGDPKPKVERTTLNGDKTQSLQIFVVFNDVIAVRNAKRLPIANFYGCANAWPRPCSVQAFNERESVQAKIYRADGW